MPKSSKSNKVNHQFFKAVRSGSLSTVQEFIDLYGLSHSPHWLDGYALLCNAIQHKRTKVAKLLLKNGSEVNSKSVNSFMTPLHYAVENDNLEVVEMLLNKGAHVDIEASDGSTPLLIAIERNYSHIIHLLIKNGADIDAKNLKNQTPLSLAIKRECSTMVRNILSYKPDSSYEYNRLALCSAVKSTSISRGSVDDLFTERNSKQIVEDLLNYGFTIKPHDVADSSLLYAAVENGYEKIVKSLLICGANVNYSETTAWGKSSLLHTAVQEGQNSIVQLLIEHGADVNSKDKTGRTPIYFAIQKKNLEIAMQLLDNKAVESSFDLLCLAIETQNTETLEKILSYNGVDINATNSSGTTALHIAIQNVQTEHSRTIARRKSLLLHTAVEENQNSIVQLLIKYRADVNSKDKTGRTPIYFAIQKKNLEIAMQLLDNKAVVESSFDLLCLAIETQNTETLEKILSYNGVDINATNSGGTTALYIATEYRQTEMVKLFLDKGANVNDVTANGETALFKACQKGYKEVVEILLDFGAKSEFEGTRHAIPLHAAAKTGHTEVIQILLRYDADIDFKNDEGETALHIASVKGYADLTDILLEHGSDINSMTKNKLTAVDLVTPPSYQSDLAAVLDYHRISYKRKVLDYLQRHMIKLTAANLYLNEKHVCSIKSLLLKNFRMKCEKEIETMKSETIVNNISFYDVLTKGMNKLMVYSRNENIMQVLTIDDYKTKFPIYANMIDLRFKKGIRRNDLLKQSYRFFHILSSSLPVLPHECIDNIFKYLSNSDLRNLINTCK